MKLENSVQLIGEVCTTPIIIPTREGVKHATFLIQTSERYRNSQGELVNDIDRHCAFCTGKMAEIIEKKVNRGATVMIEGKLTSRSFTNKENIKVHRTEIVLRDLLILQASA